MTTTYSQEDLAKQPIGYWSGEAYRRVAEALRQSLAANGLTQPQWWVLNRLDDTSRTWTRSELVEELAPYSEKEEGRSVADEVERLIDEGLVASTGDVVTMTGEGIARLAAARERNGRVHTRDEGRDHRRRVRHDDRRAPADRRQPRRRPAPALKEAIASRVSAGRPAGG